MRASTVAVAGAPGRRSRGRGGIRLSMYTVGVQSSLLLSSSVIATIHFLTHAFVPPDVSVPIEPSGCGTVLG